MRFLVNHGRIFIYAFASVHVQGWYSGPGVPISTQRPKLWKNDTPRSPDTFWRRRELNFAYKKTEFIGLPALPIREAHGPWYETVLDEMLFFSTPDQRARSVGTLPIVEDFSTELLAAFTRRDEIDARRFFFTPPNRGRAAITS
jgi:hypothetical protein